MWKVSHTDPLRMDYDFSGGTTGGFLLRAEVDPFRHGAWNAQHAVTSSSRPLSDPFGDTRFMLNELPNKLA